MMKRILGMIAALSVPGVAAASPPGGPFGIGLGGGTGPSGLSMKYHTGGTALQGVIGWGGVGDDGGYLAVSADFLLEQPEFAGGQGLSLAWNYGLGANVGVGDALALGVSAIAGLEFNIQPVPIDIVLEIRPGISLLPGFDVSLLNGGGHIRYYF